MTKKKMYRYVGRNGVLSTYIHLDGIPYTVRYQLSADAGMILTNGEMARYSIEVDELDLPDWYEIPAPKDNNV